MSKSLDCEQTDNALILSGIKVIRQWKMNGLYTA
jgi:hypothetical protein